VRFPYFIHPPVGLGASYTPLYYKITRMLSKMTDNLIHEPFTRKKTDEEKAKEKSVVMTIRLNQEELDMLKQVKEAIEQPKDSTAVKTVFYIGCFDVLHDKKVNYILSTLFKNKRNNERTGAIVD
jgi:hypothetical protein